MIKMLAFIVTLPLFSNADLGLTQTPTRALVCHLQGSQSDVPDLVIQKSIPEVFTGNANTEEAVDAATSIQENQFSQMEIIFGAGEIEFLEVLPSGERVRFMATFLPARDELWFLTLTPVGQTHTNDQVFSMVTTTGDRLGGYADFGVESSNSRANEKLYVCAEEKIDLRFEDK